MYTIPMGASSCGRGVIDKSVFKSYRDAGIKYMEVSSKPDEYELYDWDEVKKASEEYGIKIWSVHTPFHLKSNNIAYFDKAEREATLARHKFIYERAADLGAKYVIVHPSSEPIEDKDRPLAIQYSKQSLEILAKYAKEAGVKIAVENLPRTCLGNTVEELMDIISADDSIDICFDVNHLLKQSHKHFVSVAGKKIKTLHISDYDFIDERHLLPGKGKIDWKEILDLLESINYDGVFMYEVRLKPDCEPTLLQGVSNFKDVMERKI